MADSRFALSNQNIVEQLKENAKNKNTLKATQTWLNVWQRWATKRKVNPKLEEYEYKQLDKMLQIFYTEIRIKDGFSWERTWEFKIHAGSPRPLFERARLQILYYTRQRVSPVEVGTRRKSEVSPSTRVRQETQRHERTDSRGGRNAMEWEKSRRLQSKSSFPNYVVDLDSRFRPEGKTGTPFNGSRGLQFLCGRQWHWVRHI